MSEATDIHVPFMAYLDEQKVEYIRARSDRESTIESGWEDFTLLHPSFPCLLIEMKLDKKPLSPVQGRVHARHRERGFDPHICRDIRSAVALVEAWLGGLTFKTRTPEKHIHSGPRYVVFGNVVCVEGPGGALTRLRAATPADAGLPRL